MRKLFVWSVVCLFAAVMVSLAALGGSTSRADNLTQEGCMNQWLFNGLWRVDVTAVEPYMNGSQQTGWQVTEVWRNGTNGQLSPSDSQIQDQTLELGSGAITAKESSIGALSMGSVGNNSFAPAGQYTYKQIFYSNTLDPSNKPKGLLITFNGTVLAQLNKPHFSTPKYNFHFNLGCVATDAAAQAQGGSNQVAATDGCLNQWMSNGIWKMRVTAIGPNPVGAAPKDQFGWLVTQTWVNATNRGILTDGLNDQGTKFVQTHVTDEFLVTQSGNNASSANAVGGLRLTNKPGYDWPPGSDYTFSQLFVWSPFDATDAPVRLLVTFDDKTQNALPGLPHYKKPADFRIDLTCTK